MKELDFDELDRAVNSLISPTTSVADSPTSINVNVDNNTTVNKNPDSNNSSVSEPASVSTSSPTPVPTPANSLVERRRSGRFMDVVHPSSDMKTASNTYEKSQRDTITVAPRESSGVDSPAPVVEPELESVPEPKQESEPEPAPPSVAWPDPIDLDTTHSKIESVPEPESESMPESEPESIPEPESEPAPIVVEPTPPTPPVPTPKAEPVVSTRLYEANSSLGPPFISTAKVEKRPLGAFSTEAPTETPKPDTTSEASEQSAVPQLSNESVDSSQLAPMGHDETDTPLPAELQDNLLSIESDSTTSASTDVARDDEPPVGPTSITQQYTATPSSNTEKPGAIYDTKAYHKALKSPAKKKSSWWLVVWIVLLLVVGAGAGAAIYYFVLPAL